MNLSADSITFKYEEEKIDLQECISDVTKKINLLRDEVKDHMNSYHIQLQSVMSNNTNLHVNAEKLLENVKDLQLRLDTQMKREVATLTEELKSMKDSLDESTMLVEQVNKLLVIDTEINVVQSGKEYSHLDIMKHLATAQKYLQEECKDLEYLDIYKVISETITVWYSDYYKEVSKLWEEMLNITHIEVEGKDRTTLLTVSVVNEKMLDVMMTLSLLGELSRRISLFASTFYKEILVQIIEKNATASSKLKSGTDILIVSTEFKEEGDKKSPPDYAHVLKNLSIVFNYLNENLDYKIDETTIFIKELGGYIGEEFTKLLDETCLTHTIPQKREDLGNFIKVVEEILALDKLLKKMQFLDNSNETLQRYGGSVEELYLNKLIETYLATAREIMKKDIQDMKLIEPMEIKDDELMKDINTTSSVVMDQVTLGLFQFPKCCISKSAEELILLISEILKEIVTDRQANVDFALKMFGTAKDLFMIYRFAPLYHKKNVESIPQQAALLHNNLMYLAHEAMTLQLEYRGKYPPCLVQNMAHFVDLVIPLRSSAKQVLDQQVVKQQVIITDTIKKAGLTSLSDFDNLSDNTRKHLKQCLCQLSFLKNIWYNVLPANVYCRIMGQLCFLFAEEIISKVLATKDLTADTTLELATIFGSIQEDIPTLFSEPKEIHRYVKNWTKFSELVLILKGTLTEIEERWADGKGPLANEFTPLQLKHLIKALFQNSDRRAAVIASIN